jgi:hypothetical protein
VGRLNGRWEVVAVTELLDDVRGCQENVPFSKPILVDVVWWLVLEVRCRDAGLLMETGVNAVL